MDSGLMMGTTSSFMPMVLLLAQSVTMSKVELGTGKIMAVLVVMPDILEQGASSLQ